MDEELTISVRPAGGTAFTSAKKVRGRDAALRALEDALRAAGPGSKGKLDPGGELFIRAPAGGLLEVMED